MNKLITLAVCLTVAACQSQPKQADETTAEVELMKLPAPQAEAPPPAPPTAPPETPVVPRQVVRNAQLRFRVSDFAQAGQAIDGAVKQAGGTIAQANETRSGRTLENALIIRVPAARLDNFLTDVLKQSIYTDTKTITTEDVTRQYVDVAARIRSKKATEETYLRLLKQARSVDDVLKVEEQLARLREEREAQEAQLRQLQTDVAQSTINLTYYQETEDAQRPEEPFYRQIAHNLTDGFRLVGDVLIGVFYLLPLGLIVAVVGWGFVRWRRKKKGPRLP